MSGIDPNDESAVLAEVKALVAARQYRLSDHVEGRIDKHGVTLSEMLEALAGARLLENYPTYHHGPCCLVYGDTSAGRPLHLVCSTIQSKVIVVTV